MYKRVEQSQSEHQIISVLCFFWTTSTNKSSTMKFLVLAAVLACAYATPQLITLNGGLIGGQAITYTAGPTIQYAAAPAIHYASAPVVQAPVVYSAPIVAPAVTKTQYHAQDELGQASYGYAHPGQAHAALRDAFGNVRGSYAYVNPDGKEVRVNYIADAGGFRVESNDLPQAPAVPITPALVAPLPVQDTKEVAEARAAHAKAIEEAKARNAEAEKKDAAEAKVEEAKPAPSRRRRGVIAAPLSYSIAAPALTYSAISSPVIAHHAISPITYSAVAAPVAVAPAVVAAQPVREATLTKIINTPGHAVSYRVD